MTWPRLHFLAINIPSISQRLLSVFNESVSATEGGIFFALIRQINDATSWDYMADVDVVTTSHLPIAAPRPPPCSVAVPFQKQRSPLGCETYATGTAWGDYL